MLHINSCVKSCSLLLVLFLKIVCAAFILDRNVGERLDCTLVLIIINEISSVQRVVYGCFRLVLLSQANNCVSVLLSKAYSTLIFHYFAFFGLA